MERVRDVLKLAKGKRPTDKLFTDHDRHWLLYHVRRMCREAGVPEGTAHSLRGLHATLAMEWGPRAGWSRRRSVTRASP